jgi:hypothetical protein
MVPTLQGRTADLSACTTRTVNCKVRIILWAEPLCMQGMGFTTGPTDQSKILLALIVVL